MFDSNVFERKLLTVAKWKKPLLGTWNTSMNIEGDVVLSLHLMEHTRMYSFMYTMMCILLWYLHCIKKELCILRRTVIHLPLKSTYWEFILVSRTYLEIANGVLYLSVIKLRGLLHNIPWNSWIWRNKFLFNTKVRIRWELLVAVDLTTFFDQVIKIRDS